MNIARATEAIQIAAEFISGHEGLHLRAYPDPRSPMARAMTAAERARCHRTGEVPEHVRHLSAAPWTIGLGATGPTIVYGTKWTRQQALDRFGADLVAFQRAARRTWPGIDKLPARAEAAFVSLAYNRGTDLTDRGPVRDPKDRRREMRELVPAVAARDFPRMAQLFRAMRRIWDGEGMGGLIARRLAEADLIDEAAREQANG